jgi:hypothetical protein
VFAEMQRVASAKSRLLLDEDGGKEGEGVRGAERVDAEAANWDDQVDGAWAPGKAPLALLTGLLAHMQAGETQQAVATARQSAAASVPEPCSSSRRLSAAVCGGGDQFWKQSRPTLSCRTCWVRSSCRTSSVGGNGLQAARSDADEVLTEREEKEEGDREGEEGSDDEEEEDDDSEEDDDEDSEEEDDEDDASDEDDEAKDKGDKETPEDDDAARQHEEK